MKINLSSSLILFSKKLVGGTQILAPLPIGFAIFFALLAAIPITGGIHILTPRPIGFAMFLVLLAAIPITGRQLKELGGYSHLR